MTDVDSQSLFWLYQIPNLLLASLFYTLIGRFVLSLFVPDGSEMVMWKVFQQITQPAMAAVGAITPADVNPRLLVLFAALWVLMARIALFFVFAAMGWLPRVVGL